MDMTFYGRVRVSVSEYADIYRDPATGTYRYYLEERVKWSEDFDTYVEAAEDAQSDWLSDPERADG